MFSNLENSTEEDETSDFNLALELEVRFKRVSDGNAGIVRITNDPNAVAVRLEEEDFRERYPWDYRKLTIRLSKRYKDFKINKKYHDIRKPLAKDEKFCRLRLLDPGNPKSQKKEFFNPNIIREFDKYYERS